ncbi:MAG: hypothetical protein H7840_06155 [Alphaproteobacteria bacterium]
MAHRCSVADLVESLRRHRRDGYGCSVLVGAGVSASGGIPVAAGVVDLVRVRYPEAFGRATAKTYHHVLRALSDFERASLVNDLVSRARVNWAHLCLALLFRGGVVDRILTTNFDSLLLRACALVDDIPPVYDLTMSPRFPPNVAIPRGIFHLHGQRSGMVILDGRAAFDWHFHHCAPLFEDAGRRRVWIVAGYGGEGDPVFELLAKVPHFDGGLYWLGRGETIPDRVRDGLLADDRGVSFIGSCDADETFMRLAHEFGCFPPPLLTRPFSHLKETLGHIAPYTPAPGLRDFDATGSCRRWLDAAAVQCETQTPPELSLLCGDHEAVISGRETILADAAPSAVAALAWAHVSRGRDLAEKARLLAVGLAERDFARAYEDFAAAALIRPDLHEIYVHWGVALCDQAQTMRDGVADRLFAEGYRKFSMAVRIRPDQHEAYYKWGNALSAHAERLKGDQRDSVYDEAYEKYATAVSINPDMYEAFNNWGIALTDHGKARNDEGSPDLFIAACDTFANVVAVRPDMYLAYSNWGIALFNHARLTSDQTAAFRLYGEACDKYALAVQGDPTMADAYFNWAWTLTIQAQMEEGAAADALYAKAYEKFAAAVAVEPHMAESYHNWGWALAAQASHATDPEADRLYTEACACYARALEISPGDCDVLNNWGNALADQARARTGEEADRLFEEAYAKFAEAVRLAPDVFVPLTNWSGALSAHAQTKTGPDRDRLLDQAEGKCVQVEEMDSGRGTYNLACLAAVRGQEDACRQWLERARDAGYLPEHAHLVCDPDLASLHHLPWFQEFVAGLDA